MYSCIKSSRVRFQLSITYVYDLYADYKVLRLQMTCSNFTLQETVLSVVFFDQ